MDDPSDWHALDAAQQRVVMRVPFYIETDGPAGPQAVEAGSVACAHLPALARWPEALRVDGQGVLLTTPAADRDAFFVQANAALRQAGLIVAWRDEVYPVMALADQRLLATFERAASRFWGTLTLGAHCNGYVADAAGRPQRLWIARRSATKATDPGLLDNLIGGGVPHGQSPGQTVVREGWEEAGLTPDQLRGLCPGRVLQVARDIPEGFMREAISVYDLALPAELTPCNQDGEVAELMCLPVAQALVLAASDQMTVDAALVCLDFALRHQLLAPAAHQALRRRAVDLWHGQAMLP